jgi:hypothetical protein
MWLSISRDNEISSFWNNKSEKITVEVYSSLNDKIVNRSRNTRVSQLFELDESDSTLPVFINRTFMRFYFFISPMKTLGRLKKNMGKFEAKIYFGFGLCSIVIISDKSSTIDDLIHSIAEDFISFEEWEIEDNSILNSTIHPYSYLSDYEIKLNDYSTLPKATKSIFEELHLLLNIFSSKAALIPKEHLFDINKITLEINSLINNIFKYQEHINLNSKSIGNIIDIDFSKKDELRKYKQKVNKAIKDIYHKDQYVDRAVQLVSVLSYVSTQAFSGIIPVLSRRSLIRRHSLLGVGSCVMALNRITVFIEDIFHSYNWTDKLMIDFKRKNGYLPDIINAYEYNVAKWKYFNADVVVRKQTIESNQFKLPYFSARLGFRESEYSVSAAIQSITNGADREWSILTISHELMHSQVRKILNLIIAGDIKENNEKDKQEFYRVFEAISRTGFNEENTLLDSIRYIIITHCCLADKHGSLSHIGENIVAGNRHKNFNIPKDYNTLFRLLMHNFRNINEIFVHIFDFYYIYRGQLEYYLMAIWHSWSSLPHINADLRQYILRSLVVISTKVVAQDPHERFIESVSILKNSMALLHAEVEKPLIAKIVFLLSDVKKLSKDYYGGFYSHLMLADMISNIFISDIISSNLYKDDFVIVVDNNSKEEMDFVYQLNDNFEDVSIESPIAFILNRIHRINLSDDIDYSRETCKMLLSII